MRKINQAIVVVGVSFLLAACGSDGSSSTGGGGNSSAEASQCVSRSLKTIYVNECDYDVNAILFEPGAESFLIKADRAVTLSSSGNSFGACRAPSIPVLNSDSSGFSCS